MALETSAGRSYVEETRKETIYYGEAAMTNSYAIMTRLHRESDRLLDNYEQGEVSKKDRKFIEGFLKLPQHEQLTIVRWGIHEIHPQYQEAEIAKSASQILFKIQLLPHDATSFGMGTPISQREKK